MSAAPPRTAPRTAIDIAAAVRAGRLSPVDAVDAALEQIERTAGLGAFCAVAAGAARSAARRCDRRGPLAGVPFSVKDLIETAGLRTTFGSPAFADHVPARDAEAVARLRAAGAILFGKTNTAELGHSGTETRNELFGATLNPWDAAATPGGSSGGAAVAVATGCGPIAVGTDDGGSLRIPAHHCGVVGFKPSRGRVPLSAAAVAAVSPERGHIGPLARTVSDAALAFDVMAGADTLASCAGDPGPLRVGLCLEPFAVPRCEATAAGQAAAELERLGHRVIDVSDPFGGDPMAYVEVLSTAELARSAGDLDGLGESVRERIRAGRRVSAADEAAARRDAAALERRLDRLFEAIDVLVLPVVAFDPSDDGWFPFTLAFNVTGMPAMSIPFATRAGGLPCGAQLACRAGEDARLLSIAAALERARPWADRWPISASS